MMNFKLVLYLEVIIKSIFLCNFVLDIQQVYLILSLPSFYVVLKTKIIKISPSQETNNNPVAITISHTYSLTQKHTEDRKDFRQAELGIIL